MLSHGNAIIHSSSLSLSNSFRLFFSLSKAELSFSDSVVPLAGGASF